MRSLLLAALPVLALACAAPAHAVTVADPTGDFLPTFAGPDDADLDVTSFFVKYDSAANAFRLQGEVAGDIDPSKAGLYAIGVNTGTGPIAPFADVGAPNVIFNQVIGVLKTGAAFVGANPLTATIDGNVFRVVVPLALLPSTGFAPADYQFNLWPRTALGPNNALISDFAPDNATISAAVPEPATWAILLAGFALAGAALRRRSRVRAACPV